MDWKKLADLLFPHIKTTPDYWESKYPQRQLPEGAAVTRLGPSPTGFIHLGNLYGAFVDERIAHQTGGVFYLRIEDTDDKRMVEGAVEIIINSLKFFGVNFDEGATLDGSLGQYGSYVQSQRKEIYQTFAKKLVEEGKAYPCFLTEEEINQIRSKQEAEKENPGIYGPYAKYRDVDLAFIEEKLQEKAPYVLRLRSTGDYTQTGETARRIRVKDGIRQLLEMPENCQDVVLLKTNGIPTYHFAHVIDDHLMRTTHVVRGAEWLPSLPIHVEIFEKLGWDLPIYCHTAQLMKLDDEGNKRKLSKRKDPELSLDYYRQQGYHPEAVREYLMTILNSNFEEWRMENPDENLEKFPFSTEKMSNSGALFDLNKLNDISKDVLLKISASDLYSFYKNWAEEFEPTSAKHFENQKYMEKILDLGRDGNKPRKDLVYGKQILEFISYFFDDTFKIEEPMPAEVNDQDVTDILTKYLSTYNHSDDQSQWFEKIRVLGESLGYAPKPKDFKKNPDLYKGHVGHVSTVIRIALMGRGQSPDLWEIQQILGEERTRSRINQAITKGNSYWRKDLGNN